MAVNLDTVQRCDQARHCERSHVPRSFNKGLHLSPMFLKNLSCDAYLLCLGCCPCMAPWSIGNLEEGQ